jgi:LCP family protein required for cell wall assembly
MNRHDDLTGDVGQAPQRRMLSRLRRRRRAPGRRRSVAARVAGWTCVFLVVLLVAGALTAYVNYRHIVGSIKRVNVSRDLNLGPPRPPKYVGSALNILLIGSDSRSGANAKFGDKVEGQRSDTVMLLHISPGRKQATVLSFPRDSVVPVLACPAEPGTAGQLAEPGEIEQINSTFAYGGPGCLWKTLEHTTHIHIDHFIELNFTGFEKIIDDIGGVNICLPFAIDDPNSELRLSSGPHHVMGARALAFWRAREIGEGSDLQRIQRDQYLMASIVQGIARSDLLSSPARVYSVVTDTASAMTTDSNLDVGTMIKIADSLKGLPSQSVQFIETPTVPYPLNENWVQWAPRARTLFAAIAHDRTLPAAPVKNVAAAQPALRTAPPPPIDVEVLNGSGIAGSAGQAAASLTDQGFQVVGSSDAASFGHTDSVIEYASHADLAAARTLKAQVRGARLRKNPGVAAGTLDLIVGSSFNGLLRPPKHKSSSPPVSSLTGTFGGITGSANVCRDSGAFTGPNGGS